MSVQKKAHPVVCTNIRHTFANTVHQLISFRHVALISQISLRPQQTAYCTCRVLVSGQNYKVYKQGKALATVCKAVHECEITTISDSVKMASHCISFLVLYCIVLLYSAVMFV